MSALVQYCDFCEKASDIQSATVGPANPKGNHEVHECTLECGHSVDPAEDMLISHTVVQLLKLQQPDTITVTDTNNE